MWGPSVWEISDAEEIIEGNILGGDLVPGHMEPFWSVQDPTGLILGDSNVAGCPFSQPGPEVSSSKRFRVRIKSFVSLE